MFVTVEVIKPTQAQVVAVPATAIVHASFGDSVFVVEDKKPGSPGMDKTPDGKTVKIARQQFVRTGAARGDFTAITKGVTAGQTVVSAGAFKLRNNAPVVVDNTVQAKPQLAPHPENR
jgi:membrane fusion protein (multidrug efflux system)